MALFRLLLALTFVSCSSAWTTPTSSSKIRTTTKLLSTSSSSSSSSSSSQDNRREFLTRLTTAATTTTTVAASSWLIAPLPATAAAASSSQDQKDKENIIKGYNRLTYFLDNWEDETTVCKTGQETTFGDKCERTPVKVMEYLGFKSTNDPLFKAETTMMRLKNAVPNDREVDFYDAVDAYSQNSEEASSMAFVSSWGEANPGGGKDRVKLFLERSKKNVVASRDALKAVIDILDLKP